MKRFGQLEFRLGKKVTILVLSVFMVYLFIYLFSSVSVYGFCYFISITPIIEGVQVIPGRGSISV